MRKHSTEEIRAMLGKADTLARNGLSQADICSSLGISVMTLHRWRKQPFRQTSRPPPLSRSPRQIMPNFGGFTTSNSKISGYGMSSRISCLKK